MLSQNDTKLISEIGAGKPMGELFRRFWLPIVIASEIAEPDCTPVAIRILGEDLIVFRDTQARPGVISAYCAHRHAHLFWGRNEESGLRCTYHGWKYDVNGQCVDMPNEPTEAAFKEKISIKSYPAREAGGCIWAYIGPPELQPEDLPGLEWAHLPPSHVLVTKRLQENNWAQAVEGGIDSSHISYLHGGKPPVLRQDAAANNLSNFDGTPMMLTTDRDFGFIEAARRRTEEGRFYWRVRPFLVPSYIVIPGGDQPDRNLGGHVWVPVDDEHVWAYTLTWNATRPLKQEEIDQALAGFGTHAEVDKELPRWDLKISNSWTPIRN